MVENGYERGDKNILELIQTFDCLSVPKKGMGKEGRGHEGRGMKGERNEPERINHKNDPTACKEKAKFAQKANQISCVCFLSLALEQGSTM